MKLKTTIFALSVVGLTTINGPASAASAFRGYSGVNCVPSSDYYSTPQYWSGIAANGSSPNQLQCSIDTVNYTNTKGVHYVVVKVYNPSTSDPVGCGLDSRTPTGQSVQRNVVRATAVGQTSLSLSVNASAYGGYYSLGCYLPPNAKIYSYSVGERG